MAKRSSTLTRWVNRAAEVSAQIKELQGELKELNGKISEKLIERGTEQYFTAKALARLSVRSSLKIDSVGAVRLTKILGERYPDMVSDVITHKPLDALKKLVLDPNPADRKLSEQAKKYVRETVTHAVSYVKKEE